MNVTTTTGFTVKDAVWYTPMGGPVIGIVSGETKEGEKKSYIGVGSGIDEEGDALYIAETGARFYGKEAE